MVFRVHKTADYTVMSNYHLRDANLSLKAKGLLSLMLSLPDEWDYSITGLVALSRDGRDSVNAGLAELEKGGYLIRTQSFDESGKFAGFDYEIFEEPFTEKPFTEKPSTEKPSTGNPQQSSTKRIKYLKTKAHTQSAGVRERTHEGAQAGDGDFVPPTVAEVHAFMRKECEPFDAVRFVNYYDTVGWRLGGQPIRDWHSLAIMWGHGEERIQERFAI